MVLDWNTKENTSFTILAKNKKGDPVGAGGDRFDIKITGPYDSGIYFLINDIQK
jgi:hypothetical protein